MLSGLGSLIDRVTGLFGKAYLLAGFLPVLLLAGVSLLAGYDASDTVRGFVREFRGMGTAEQALASGALLVSLAVLGFVFWSANPWWRAVMEGDVLPERVRDWMIRSQRDALDLCQKELDEWGTRLFIFRRQHPDQDPPAEARFQPWRIRLLRARQTGGAMGAPPSTPSNALAAAFDHLRDAMAEVDAVEPATLDPVCNLLEAELAAAPAGPAMDALHQEFLQMAAEARDRVESAYLRALNERRGRFPLEPRVVGPTGMANVTEIYRNHALKAYGLDTGQFWLHLQRAAAADDRFRPILEEAKLKLDVSVAMTAACVLASLWAVALAFTGTSLAAFLVTAVGMPAAALLFYRASVSNLRAFGEAVRATVDLFRFDVLKALHLALPANSDAERALWEKATWQMQLLGEARVKYVHP